MKDELKRWAGGRFNALIFDNEVTVGEFVTSPPLPWMRLAQQDGIFQAAHGSPAVLTAEQAKFEMRNWDQVSLAAISRGLAELDESVNYVLFGNNAGQGLPLAQALPAKLVAEGAAIIYAHSLPEQGAYEQTGYKKFFRRSEAVAQLLERARRAGKPLALSFVNTIQHNERNYHDP